MALSPQEVRELVTSRIEAELSKGRVPWQRPWVGDAHAPRNLQSGKAYRGINALLLCEFITGYSDPRWTTFNAARKMGGKVRKGEKTSLVTLWKRIRVKDADAPDGAKIIPILRYFRVLNVEQIDWPEGVLPELSTSQPKGFDPIEAAEDAFQTYIDSDDKLRVTWGDNTAHYDPRKHCIGLPDRERFPTPAGFYGTAFHESAHSTAPSLGRDISGSFGSDPYGREELVAEMAQAFICAELGVEVEYTNSAAYIAGWMRAIHDDDKLILKAAGQAQKAADRILLRTFDEPDSPVEVTIETETSAVSA